MLSALHQHWPEYLIEAGALGVFMITALLFTVLLEHPESAVRRVIRSAFARRALIGLAMGLTAIGLIYSPWGQRSGAQMNPAVTLTFLYLGKIKAADATFYILAQFVGGLTGVLLAKSVLRTAIAHPSVNHVATVPGPGGTVGAFAAEVAIACGMMLMVLTVTNTPKLTGFTGLFAGTLVFLYITFEAPLSGMSMNPARTFASALPSGVWTGSWIYFTAPVLGMFLAAQAFIRLNQSTPSACPKLHHGTEQRCIFCHMDSSKDSPSPTTE